ncbi:MAG: hypothetical protein AB1627_04050 [Chloroflexota bacterium]
MRGCLFVIALGLVTVALVVVVGLPALFAGVLTAGVTAAGLQSDDTTVTVTSDPPTDLVGLHADRVRVRATDATFRGLEIGALDVTLGDVAIVDRTAGSVDGRLSDVVVPNVGAREVRLESITLGGGGEVVTATTTVEAAQAGRLVADALEAELGTRPASVTLTAPDRISVSLGVAVHGRLSVTAAGDLVVTVSDGPAAGREITLLQGGEDLPIRLTSVRIAAGGGMRLAGELAVALLG